MLAHYYPTTRSLRQHLLSKLPSTSKIRRRRLTDLGRNHADVPHDRALAKFLDETLIGVSELAALRADKRREGWLAFSQRGDTSVSTLTVLNGPAIYSQAEVSSQRSA